MKRLIRSVRRYTNILRGKEIAEYGVISDGITSGAFDKIRQVLVEFHHNFSGFGLDETRRAINQLAEAGFGIAWVSGSGHEVLFARKPCP